MSEQGKPKVSYAAFAATLEIPKEPTLADFDEMTLAWIFQRFIEEARLPGSRPIGESTLYAYGAIQREEIGKKNALKLKALDFIDYGKRRKAGGASPATISHDMSHMRVVLRHAKEVWEIEGVTLDAWQIAKTQMDKQQIVGKSSPRDRRPTLEEIAKLRDFFGQQNAHPNTDIDMLDVIDFQIASGRRISETCRIRRKDIDVEKRLCWMYNLKNPKGKGFHAQFPLLGDAWVIVERRLASMPADPEARVFPYNSKSCTQRFIDAKAKLGIVGVRLHDCRREALSRLFEEGFEVQEVAKVSLHKNPSILLGVYTNIPPESLHKGPASKREAAPSR